MTTDQVTDCSFRRMSSATGWATAKTLPA